MRMLRFRLSLLLTTVFLVATAAEPSSGQYSTPYWSSAQNRKQELLLGINSEATTDGQQIVGFQAGAPLASKLRIGDVILKCSGEEYRTDDLD